MEEKKKIAKISSIEDIRKIMQDEQVIDVNILSIDEDFSLHCSFTDDIQGIIPREEVSCTLDEETGEVKEKECTNKVGKRVQVQVKDIIEKGENKYKVILSKRAVEHKVRKWMYMHLKPGMKLKGFVRNITQFGVFIDVGAGVTGLLKIEDISVVRIMHPNERFKLGQRVEVLVKRFDRDTGKIEFTYKELLGTFEENIKGIREGEVVEGIVRAREKNGIFIELKPNLVGLAEHRSGVEYGQKVLVHVKRIIKEKKKIKLIIVG